MTKLWGNSRTDLYGVGNAGTIIHYANGVWQKITSAVTEDIQDIWGYQNTFGQTTILSISSTLYYGGTENLLS
ncbi:MAG: glucosyl transferase, partial [Ignavibacteria bacterium]|nr:glucosyl transferase [Ignavibacteria bacterium]